MVDGIYENSWDVATLVNNKSSKEDARHEFGKLDVKVGVAIFDRWEHVVYKKADVGELS